MREFKRRVVYIVAIYIIATFIALFICSKSSIDASANDVDIQIECESKVSDLRVPEVYRNAFNKSIKEFKHHRLCRSIPIFKPFKSVKF